MYILVGRRSELVDDIWAGKSECPHCGKICDFHLTKLVGKGTIFFIPVMSITQKKYIECDCCQWSKKISGKEFKTIKKKQMKLLEEGKFPEDIIKTDCNPVFVKFNLRLIKLILSGILAAFMFIVGIGGIVSDIARGKGILQSLWLSIVIVGFYSIPFLLSLKNFIPAFKMKKAYDSLMWNQNRID